NPVSPHPSANDKAAAAELVRHVFPSPVVRLCARGVAFVADANWSLEYFGIEALDRLVSPLQVVEIQPSLLGRRGENGSKVAALCLMLAGIRFISVANPAYGRAPASTCLFGTR